MSNIIINKSKRINRRELDINQYTVSLLKQGYEASLVGEGTINRFQIQLQEVLKDLILEYTNGNSSSVKVETAERILISLLYCIDAYIGDFRNLEDALAIIDKDDIKDIYIRGYDHVKQCLNDTEMKYKEITEKKLDIPLEIYKDTLENALGDFFKVYEMKFNSHDTMTSIDYPLVFDDMSIRGVYYIKNYIANLDIENYFCSFFSISEINKIIKFYGQLHSIKPRDLYINVFEIVINNSVFSLLSHGSVNNLIISNQQYSYLTRRLGCLQPHELEHIIEEAIYKILENLSCSNIEVKSYLKRYKKLLVLRILNAVDGGDFKYLIIKDNYKEMKENGIEFKEGDRMDDESFRSTISKVCEASELSHKISIIRSSVGSLGDFIDILNSECLFGDEYLALYSDMKDIELAMLVKILLRDEFEGGRIDHIDILDVLEKRYIGSVWEEYLVRFICSLGLDRLKYIEGIVDGRLYPDIQNIKS